MSDQVLFLLALVLVFVVAYSMLDNGKKIEKLDSVAAEAPPLLPEPDFGALGLFTTPAAVGPTPTPAFLANQNERGDYTMPPDSGPASFEPVNAEELFDHVNVVNLTPADLLPSPTPEAELYANLPNDPNFNQNFLNYSQYSLGIDASKKKRNANNDLRGPAKANPIDQNFSPFNMPSQYPDADALRSIADVS